jgi:hypothetical protein
MAQAGAVPCRVRDVLRLLSHVQSLAICRRKKAGVVNCVAYHGNTSAHGGMP